MSFTPGPWTATTAEPDETTREPAIRAGVLYIATAHDVDCGRAEHAGDTAANASLIAAAPDMLQALLLVIADADRVAPRAQALGLPEPESVRWCRAALAKARQ